MNLKKAIYLIIKRIADFDKMFEEVFTEKETIKGSPFKANETISHFYMIINLCGLAYGLFMIHEVLQYHETSQ